MDIEIIIHDDNTATYKGYRYARKSYAFLRRARDNGRHSISEWLDLCNKYDYKCCSCGSNVIGGIPTKDHIIPTIYNESHDGINNLQPLCRECNTSKGQQIINYRWNG